jgi:hypothetical protein
MIDLDRVMRALKAIYETLGDEAEVIILVVPPQVKRRIPVKTMSKRPTRAQVLAKIRASQLSREVYLPADPDGTDTATESGRP